MKGHIIENKFQEKPLFIVGDLNINSLDYSRNIHVHDFFNFDFQNSIFPVINRPTKVTKSSATLIDHILTKTVIDTHTQSGIIKTDTSDHFAVLSLNKTNLEQTNIKKTIIKRDINEDSMKYFKTIINSNDWDLLTQTLSTNDDSYNTFLERFIKIHDQAFPERKIKIKQKNLSSTWISKGLRISSKRKQRLYEKFLKQRIDKNYKTYKIYKNLFDKSKKETVKKTVLHSFFSVTFMPLIYISR